VVLTLDDDMRRPVAATVDRTEVTQTGKDRFTKVRDDHESGSLGGFICDFGGLRWGQGAPVRVPHLP